MLLRYFGCKIVGHPPVRVRPVGRSTTKQCRSPPAPSFGPVLNAACGKVTMRVNNRVAEGRERGREGYLLPKLSPFSRRRWPRRTHSTLSSVSPPSSHGHTNFKRFVRPPAEFWGRELASKRSNDPATMITPSVSRTTDAGTTMVCVSLCNPAFFSPSQVRSEYEGRRITLFIEECSAGNRQPARRSGFFFSSFLPLHSPLPTESLFFNRRHRHRSFAH